MSRPVNHIISLFFFAVLLFSCKRSGTEVKFENTGSLCVIEGQVTTDVIPNAGPVSRKYMMVFDEWNGHELIASSRINDDGSFRLQIDASKVTHIYLYAGSLRKHDGAQFRDFMLEPGIIEISGDFSDESIFTRASGAPLNDKWNDFQKRMRAETIIEKKRQLFDEFMTEGTEDELRLMALEYLTSPDSDIYFKTNCYRLFKTLDKRLQKSRYEYESLEEYFQTISSTCQYFKPGAYYCNVQGTSLCGERKELSDYFNKGKYILVDYWGSWCSACVAGLPEITEFARKNGDDITLVGINVNEPLKLKELSKFAKEHGITWDLLVTEQGAIEYVRSFPFMALYDDCGRLIESGHPMNLLPDVPELVINERQ